MAEKNYVLAQSFGRSNIQNRLRYVMDTADLETLKTEETILFGDKAYVIKTQKMVIMGNDSEWYDMAQI